MTDDSTFDLLGSSDQRTGWEAAVMRSQPSLVLVTLAMIGYSQITPVRQWDVTHFAVAIAGFVALLFMARDRFGGLRTIPVAALALLLVSGFASGAIVALAPLAILGAIQWADLDHRRTGPDRDVVFILGAGLALGILFSNLRFGPWQNNSSTGDGESGRQLFHQREGAGSSAIGRFLARVWQALFGEQQRTGGEPGGAARAQTPPDPPDPLDWQRTAMLLALVAMLVLLLWGLWWLARRWMNERRLDQRADLVRRFDRTGARTFRKRQPFEGLNDYGRRATSAAGDERLDQTGQAISAVLYDPSTPDTSAAADAVENLETHPPPKKPSRWPGKRKRSP